MSGKSWQELLLQYLTGALSDEDRSAFEQYLAESDAHRAELEAWHELAAAVRDESDSRVDKLPMLPKAFYQRLEIRPQRSLNGSHSNHVAEIERKTMTIARPISDSRSDSLSHRFKGLSLTLAAALIAVVMFGSALLLFGGRPGPDHNASGLSAQRESATPVPSATFVPNVTPEFTATPFLAPLVTQTMIPSVTHIEIEPTVPPPETFLVSVTPSFMEPIVSSPARLVEETGLLTGDASRSIAWSPNGAPIAVAGFRGIWLYDANLIAAPRVLSESDPGVIEVAFSQDGSLLATLSAAQTLRIWDVETGTQIAEMAQAPLWDDLQFSPDDRYLLSKNGEGRVLLDKVRGGVLEVQPLPAADLQGYYTLLNPDGKTMYGVNNGGEVIVLDFATGRELSRWSQPSEFVRQAAVNADGTRLALGADDSVNVVDASTGENQASINVVGMVSSMDFSDDNRFLAVAMRSEQINSVWMLDIEKQLNSLILVYNLPIAGIAFNPEGNLLAVTTDDGRVFMLEIDG